MGKGWSSEEFESKHQLPGLRGLDFTLKTLEGLPCQLYFPRVMENVSEPLLTAFPVSENPLNQGEV